MDTLHRYNVVCGSLHSIQGLGVLVFSFTNSDAKNMLVPITSLYCNWDVGYPVQTQGLITYFTYVRIASLFSLLSAAAHFTVLLNWDRYTSDLAKGLNRFRWIEYSLSSSLILCLLTTMWGNYDFVQLSGAFLINACMCLFGDLHEVLNSGKEPAQVDWSAFIYGSICGSVTWGMLWYAVLSSPYK